MPRTILNCSEHDGRTGISSLLCRPWPNDSCVTCLILLERGLCRFISQHAPGSMGGKLISAGMTGIADSREPVGVSGSALELHTHTCQKCLFIPAHGIHLRHEANKSPLALERAKMDMHTLVATATATLRCHILAVSWFRSVVCHLSIIQKLGSHGMCKRC